MSIDNNDSTTCEMSLTVGHMCYDKMKDIDSSLKTIGLSLSEPSVWIGDTGATTHNTAYVVGTVNHQQATVHIEFAQDDQEEWNTVGGSAGCEQWIKAASEQEPRVSRGLSSQSYYYILQEEQEEVSMQDDDGTEESQDNALTSFDLTYSEVDSQEYMEEKEGAEKEKRMERFLSDWKIWQMFLTSIIKAKVKQVEERNEQASMEPNVTL
jgi:hypothetical protein